MNNEELFTTLVKAYIPTETIDNYFMIHIGTIRVWLDHKYVAIVELAPKKLSSRIIPFMTYENNLLTVNKFHPLVIYQDAKQFNNLNNNITEFNKLILSIPSPDGLWLIKFQKRQCRYSKPALSAE
jgi:hypothetical protein